MDNVQDGFSERVQLPEALAKAFIADAECQVIIEPLQNSDESITTVSRIEEHYVANPENHSKLYHIGDGYISFELRGNRVSEVIAFHEEQFPEYVHSIFVDEPKRIVKAPEINLNDINSLVP